MKISELGEFGFIDAIKDNTIFNPDSVVIGIGDDGAVYRTTDGMEQVAVIDTMVENGHFIIGRTATWYDVGYKAVASNLSDIAATYCSVRSHCAFHGVERSAGALSGD